MKLITLFLLGLLITEEPSSYSGQWKNLTSSEKGNLTVTAIPLAEEKWKMTFVGELDETPFDYEIIMSVIKDTEPVIIEHPLKLEGSVSAGGNTFIVTINLGDEKLNGQFSSSSSKGEFHLRRKK